MTDILVFSPHPDDAEIHCGGTIALHARLGASVAVVDATRGEMSSRGTPEERDQEAKAAGGVLRLSARENLGLRDGHIKADDLDARACVVDALRRHKPATVICLHGHARHPDHRALCELVTASIKAAALHKLKTPSGAPAHTGMKLWYAEAELRVSPDFLVPLREDDWNAKMTAVRCYRSQLHQPGVSGPATGIAKPDFLDWIDARGKAWGREAGAPYAEAFCKSLDVPRVADLRSI